MKRRGYQPIITVYCPQCKNWFDEQKVEFVNIEEDIQGQDVLTFKCPTCKKTVKSFRRG